jgi:bifunctional DNase/RNase
MEKVELTVLRLTYSHTNAGAYVLILTELRGDRRLPIIIGGVEAQAIAIQVENIRPARPLTHDLFKNFCDQFGIILKEVVINDLVEGVFHAKLVLEQNGKIVEVDTRTSDSIALALRFGCPIYTYEFILGAAGLHMDETGEEGETALGAPSKEKDIHAATQEELTEMLHAALESEDYEGASKLRDELNRRKGSN